MNWEEITAYHRLYGDDYGSEKARNAKYRVILDSAEFEGKLVLDAGCGERQFFEHLPACSYRGIDLLEGDNILDHHSPYQIVVANGLLYKLPSVGEAMRLIHHLWDLTEETLIFTSLSQNGGERLEGELTLAPIWTLAHCFKLTPLVALRHDYLPGDFLVVLRR